MKMYRAWWAAACVASVLGCSKGDSAGGTSGTVTTSATGAAGAAAGGAAKPAAPAPAAVAPDAYVQNLVDSVGRGDAGAVWNALPAKYQADVTGLKNDFAAKIDADMWNKAFVIAGKLNTLLKDKKAMILASPAAATIPPPVKMMAEQNWDNVTSALNTLVTSEIKTIDGLKNADPGRFLGSTGTTLLAGIMKAVEASNPDAAAGIAKVRKSKVELVKQDGDTATLRLITEGETPEEKEFTKVDGKWLPADLVKEWDTKIADAKADLAGVTITPEMKTQFNGVVGMVEPILDKLIAAKDQATFDGEVAGLLALAQMMGGGPPGGAMQGPPGGSTAPGALTPPAGGLTPPAGGLTPPAGITAPPGGISVPPPGGAGTITVPPTGVTPPSGLPTLPPSGGTSVVPPTIVPPTVTPPTVTPPTVTPPTIPPATTPATPPATTTPATPPATP